MKGHTYSKRRKAPNSETLCFADRIVKQVDINSGDKLKRKMCQAVISDMSIKGYFGCFKALKFLSKTLYK